MGVDSLVESLQTAGNTYHKLLLVPNNHARSAEPHPRDQCLGLKVILVHDIAPYQSSCATQACPAVNRDRLPFADIAAGHIYEVLDDGVIRAAAIRELHLVHADALSLEVGCIVKLVIQSDDSFHLRLEEVAHQVARPHCLGAKLAVTRGRRCKRDYLSGDHPAEITALQDPLEVRRVESLKVVPAEFHGALQAVDAIDHCERKVARSDTSVPKRMKSAQEVFAESLLYLANRKVLANKQVCRHEEGCIGHWLLARGTLMEHFSRAFGELKLYLLAVLVHIVQRERAEVIVVAIVDVAVVDVDHCDVAAVPQRLCISVEIQSA